MKEVLKEKTVPYTVYEAIDGTKFTTKEECAKYEQTAKCVIRSRFNKLIVDNTHSEWDMFGGSDDCLVVAVKMDTKEDIDTVLQAFYIDNPWFLDDDNNNRKKKEDIIHKAFNEKDVLLMGYNCDGDLYINATRNTIIEKLNNLDKDIKKDEA